MNRISYLNRLLIIAGIFLIFFVVAIVGLPIFNNISGISLSTRKALLIDAVFQAIVLFILPSYVCATIFTRRATRYLQLNKSADWLNILGIILAFVIALPALNQIIFWNANISFPVFLEKWEVVMKDLENSAQSATDTMLDTGTINGLIVNLLVIGLLTAFAEEMFFRGLLQHTASQRGNAHAAIWIVALIFSAFHFQIYGFIPRLLMGAWFGYLLYWTGSLYVPICAHFLNNGLVVLANWLISKHLIPYNFDNFGVVQYGFPLPAFISAIAFVVFVYYFRSLFFPSKIKHVNGRNL